MVSWIESKRASGLCHLRIGIYEKCVILDISVNTYFGLYRVILWLFVFSYINTHFYVIKSSTIRKKGNVLLEHLSLGKFRRLRQQICTILPLIQIFLRLSHRKCVTLAQKETLFGLPLQFDFWLVLIPFLSNGLTIWCSILKFTFPLRFSYLAYKRLIDRRKNFIFDI